MSNKWSPQSDNGDSFSLVTDSYCRDGTVRTDFLVFDRSDPSTHAHIAFDQNGNEVYSRNPFTNN